MSAICADMAAGLADCRYGWRVDAAVFENGKWSLGNEASETLASKPS